MGVPGRAVAGGAGGAGEAVATLPQARLSLRDCT